MNLFVNSYRHMITKSTYRTLILTFAFLTISILTTPSYSYSQPTSAKIEIGGKMVMDSQLPFGIQQQLFEVDHSVYKVKLDIYHNHLFQEHVKSLAAKQNQSIETVTAELLKVKDPTNAELKAYYDTHVNSKEYPFDAIKTHLKTNVIETKQKDIKKTIVSKIEQQLGFKYLITQPQPPVAQLALADAATKGAQKPKVTVVKFSDFYCGMCRSMSQTLTKLLADKTYSTSVEVVYAPFPVFGPKATTISIQSYCAHQQEQFWNFHDKIFAGESAKLSPTTAQAVVQELKLNHDTFDKCMKSKAANDFVSTSKDLGTQLGVSGTPTLFVNGIKVPSPTESALKEALDQALAAK